MDDDGFARAHAILEDDLAIGRAQAVHGAALIATRGGDKDHLVHADRGHRAFGHGHGRAACRAPHGDCAGAPGDDAGIGGQLRLERGGTGGRIDRVAHGGDCAGHAAAAAGHRQAHRLAHAHLADQPLGQLGGRFITAGSIDHEWGGGAINRHARLDIGLGHAAGDRRSQGIGAAAAPRADQRQDARLFADVGAGLGRDGAGFVGAGTGDDPFAAQLRQARRARLRHPGAGMGAGEIGR